MRRQLIGQLVTTCEVHGIVVQTLPRFWRAWNFEARYHPRISAIAFIAICTDPKLEVECMSSVCLNVTVTREQALQDITVLIKALCYQISYGAKSLINMLYILWCAPNGLDTVQISLSNPY